MASKMGAAQLVLLSWLAMASLGVQQASPAGHQLDLAQLNSNPAAANPVADSQLATNFDSANFRSLREAIQAHPDLREFASLCEADEVRPIIGMDKVQQTVFAPIDKSLADLLSKSKSRDSINLIELAKHHIAPGLVVAPDDEAPTSAPLKFHSHLQASPLYLVALAKGATYVNNARILATYLIQPEPEASIYQTLHIIDRPLEFAYHTKRIQLPRKGSTQVKAPLALEDLLQSRDSQSALYDFHERFADLQTGRQSPQLELYQPRVFRGSLGAQERLQLSRDQLRLDRLGARLRRQSLRLPGVPDGGSLNTYFLPVESDAELDSLLATAPNLLDAMVVPDRVLFTRTMGLGRPQPTHYSSSSHSVSLSLAKTMPLPDMDQQQQPDLGEGRRLLATPLLLQAKCSPAATQTPSTARGCRLGVTSSEILVANIPLSNGVLHLIRRSLLASDSSLLSYLNDNDNQLSQVLNALGSRTSSTVAATEPIRVNRFRELLAREHELLQRIAQEGTNKTLLVPSDEAFGRLRYDLRGLVMNDESLVPSQWDEPHRRYLIEQLVRRHLIPRQVVASDSVALGEREASNDLGNLLSFSATNSGELQVELEQQTSAHLLHHDLMATNGLLHVLDRVLGEEQETVHSLLKSMVLRFGHQQVGQQLTVAEQLTQLVQSNLQTGQHPSTASDTQQISQQQPQQQQQQQELAVISKSIQQYLDELQTSQSGRSQLQALGASVNISFHLARLTSLAERSHDDWNDRFKQSQRQFTYFVPTDLAWIRLQQQQPELYRPLMYFLERPSSLEESAGNVLPPEPTANGTIEQSKSSHRLRQILERHLVPNRKIGRRELAQLDSLQTMGATLRLVETGQATAALPTADTPQATFAAFHSILGQQPAAAEPKSQQHLKLKTLKLGDSSSANILQANEASNGWVYLIDNVLVSPEDADYIVQTSSPGVSSSMSSLLGGHQSALLDFLQNLLTPAPFNLSAGSLLILIGSLAVAIALLLVVAIVLVMRRRCQSKLHSHQQLESGLTSGSSANSGSTSTTKSL